MFTAPIEQHESLMKSAYLLLCAASFALTSIGLEVDWVFISLAIGGSLAGSMLLGYFRREKSLFEQGYKILAASVAGLIVGSVIVRYRSMEDPAYIAAVYSASGCLVLFFIRTIVGLAESNAGSITTTLIERVFNIELQKKGKAKRGSMISVVPDECPLANDRMQISETTKITETTKDK